MLGEVGDGIMPRLIIKGDTDAKAKSDRELRLVMAGLKDDLESIGKRVLDGAPATEALSRAYNTFRTNHERAAMIGFTMGSEQFGLRMPFTRQYQMFAVRKTIGRRAGHSQNFFFRSLHADLEAGRYDGERGAGLDARLQLYANRLVGTANEGWADAAGMAGLLVKWLLGANENHCGDCVYESRQPWRNPREMNRFVGDGSTECLLWCWCVMIAENGSTSFTVRGGP